MSNLDFLCNHCLTIAYSPDTPPSSFVYFPPALSPPQALDTWLASQRLYATPSSTSSTALSQLHATEREWLCDVARGFPKICSGASFKKRKSRMASVCCVLIILFFVFKPLGVRYRTTRVFDSPRRVSMFMKKECNYSPTPTITSRH